MKRNLRLSLALGLLTGVSTLVQAQTSTWKIDPAHSGVEFKIRHLAVSNVHGSITGVNGTLIWDEKDPTKSSVTATIDTTTLTTNNPDRDKHLKSPDFFEVDKFPTMTFKSTKVEGAPGHLTITGDLTLHGVTKSITLQVDGPSAPQVNRGKTVSGFSTSGTLKRSDFGFGPKFSPPTIGDEVQFSLDLEVDKQ